MSARSAWSLWFRFVCVVVGLALVGTVLLLGGVYLIIASGNQRGGSPTNIAVAPDGTVYVNDHGLHATMLNIASPCIWVIDSQNDRLVGLIKIERGGDGIGVAPNGKVYVFSLGLADHPPADVEVFDPRTSRVSRITVPSRGFYSISFTPDGQALLNGSDGWCIIDTTTDQLITTLPIGGLSIAALSESKFYLAGDGVGIMIMDGGKPTIRWVQGIPRGHCIDVTVVPAGQRAYASYSRGSYWEYQFGVLVINTQTDTVIRDIPLPTLVVGMVPLPDGRFYALCNGPDGAYYVVVVDPQRGTILKTIPLGREPRGGYQNLGIPQSHRMVLAPNGKVYIVRGTGFVYGGKPPGEEQGIGVYVVDPATDTVVNFIPLEPPLWDRLFPFLSVEQAVAYLGQLWAIVASSFP